MNTRDLIDRLASYTSAMSEHSLRNGLLAAFALGIGGSFAFMMALYGSHAVAGNAAATPLWWIVLILCFGIAAAGAFALLPAARPGPFPTLRALFPLSIWIALVFIGLSMIPAIVPAPRAASLMASGWRQCLLCIPLFAIPPALILFAALRSAAPSAPFRTGALVGLVAGASGTMAFACCGVTTFSTVMTLWYGVAIALCSTITALTGRSLLQW